MKALFTALLLTFFLLPAYADECKKMVFNTICLGGDIKAVLEDNPPLRSRNSNGRKLHILNMGDMRAIGEFKGKAYAVSKMIQKPSWLKYSNYLIKLTELYGEPEDYSYYPEYASNRDSKDTAIFLEKGKAHHKWIMDGWEISLSWRGKSFISLFYKDSALNNAYKNQNNEGL